jgi:hypothetical protein
MSDEHATAQLHRGPNSTTPGLVARLARTPLLDLARGRISGRMDARRQVTHAQLPAELAALVVRTTRRTRLRHKEQHDIADELIAHLQDGLTAGVAADELARRFGDPAFAAQVLRWAALRRRSHPHRLLRRAVQMSIAATLLILVTYAILVVRHETSRPNVAHDYLADINKVGLAVAEADRAWPLYRQALMALEPFPVDESQISEQAYLHNWAQIADYLQRNRPAFELARQAAAKPRLGFWYGDPDDEPWLDSFWPDRTATDSRVAALNSLATPQMDELARLRRLLLADSRRAVASGEDKVFVANLRTLLGMADHLRDGSPMIMAELRAFACYGTGLQLMGTMLADKPDLLTDEDLVDLAHRFAAFSGGGTLRANLEGERLLFEDLLQRIYTDNGRGDGRLTPEGYTFLQQLHDAENPLNPRLESDWDPIVEPLTATALSLVTAGRKEMSQMADRLVLRFQAERAGPLWQWDVSTAEAQIQELLGSPYLKLRYWPVLYIFPGFQHVALRGEVLTQQRDATLAAIALELHHRRHGAWPQSLEELTPFPLPKVPLDRFTGQPLRFRLVDGQPLLYSTGVDRDDDGGRAHRMGNDLAQRWEPWAKVITPPRLVNDGFGNLVYLGPKFDWDWILWPQPIGLPPAPDQDDGDSE